MIMIAPCTAHHHPQLDPATSSQFLLNCFRLLVGPRMPVVLGTAPAQEGGVSGVAVDTVSTVDTNDFKDGEADASNPVADTALPSHVWQQREQLSHLVLDLAEGPFAVGLGVYVCALYMYTYVFVYYAYICVCTCA